MCMELVEISGLAVLTILREILLDHHLPYELINEVQRQVVDHLKHARLMIS